MPAERSNDVTMLLAAIGEGDGAATDELLPLVYDELRRIARHRMAMEAPGHTLQATALVHEAYLHLLGDGGASWESRRHFFGAAARAMQRILVDSARRKLAVRHGGLHRRRELEDVPLTADEGPPAEVLALDAALDELRARDPRMHEIAMLRHFAGLTNEQTARALGLSTRTVRREWSYARVWLTKVLLESPGPDRPEGPDDG
ncbi:MAG: sigma-70 family RNA polymerase sigma factor [Planctomycetota bacterium]|jgi:RNA polymerase sigma factor (TIGR02999 family)